MSDTNQGGLSYRFGPGVHPPVVTAEDGTVSYDSSREPEATGRKLTQNSIAPNPLPGSKESMSALPRPVSDVRGNHDDLLEPQAKMADRDDWIGDSPGFTD